MKGALFVAWRLFTPNRLRKKGKIAGHPLLGAGTGIALSVIPLVVVEHFSDSMVEGIVSRYRETSSYHFQVELPVFRNLQKTESRNVWKDFETELTNLSIVETAWLERSSFALAKGPSARDGVIVRAIPEDAYIRDTEFARYIAFDSGTWDLIGRSILLGRDTSRRLGASVGDFIILLTVNEDSNGKITPKITRLEVRGIFSTGYQDLDKTWTFVSSETGWAILPESSNIFIGGKYSGNGYKSPQSTQELRRTYGKEWNIEDWRNVNWYLMEGFSVTRGILLLIMSMIALIGILNVTSSILMLTLERRREIGIMKCTGTSPRTVAWAFTFAGLFAAFIGTIVGLSIGLIISLYINEILSNIDNFLALVAGLFGVTAPTGLLNSELYLQDFTIKLRWLPVLWIGIATLILASVAALIPSARASRLKPLEVLRKH